MPTCRQRSAPARSSPHSRRSPRTWTVPAPACARCWPTGCAPRPDPVPYCLRGRIMSPTGTTRAEVLAALPTFFDERGELDRAATTAHLAWLAGRVDGVFVAGTTGE